MKYLYACVLGLHPLYEEVTMKDGKTLYYNKHSGRYDIIVHQLELWKICCI